MKYILFLIAATAFGGCLQIDSIKVTPVDCDGCATKPADRYEVIGHNSCKITAPSSGRYVVELSFYDDANFRLGVDRVFVLSLLAEEKFRHSFDIPLEIKFAGVVHTINVRSISISSVYSRDIRSVMETQQSNFEGWAVVEMMGHQREIGFVTTQAFGQAVMFRIDTPELQEREFVLTTPEYVQSVWMSAGTKVKRAASPARSRLVSPGSLYAINPCTEEAARAAIEQTSSRPLILVEAPKGLIAEAVGDHKEQSEDESEYPS